MKPISAFRFVVLVMFAGLATVPAARAADVETELDFSTNVRLLATYFGGYGYYPKQCVVIPPKGTSIRLYLPAAEGVGQTGLYSFLSLAGNFEVSAAYSWDAVQTPEKGYGASCGIAVEVVETRKTVSVARGFLLGKGQGHGYVVVRGDPAAEKDKYALEHFSATKATGGRLVLRREQTDVICLAGDGMQSELRELCRVPIGDTTVRPVRLFADTGGSPTSLDARLGFIRLRADEIAGGIIQHEQSSTIGWWLGGGAAVVVVAGVWFFLRRSPDKPAKLAAKPAPTKPAPTKPAPTKAAPVKPTAIKPAPLPAPVRRAK